MKALKKAKARPLGKLKGDAWDAFSLYVRTADCIRTTGTRQWALCITCGKRYHMKVLQAGHFIPGRHNAMLFSEKGTHAQCYNCNINLKGNTLEYRRQIIRLYGEGADEELERLDQEVRQYKRQDYIDLKELYKWKLEKLENG